MEMHRTGKPDAPNSAKPETRQGNLDRINLALKARNQAEILEAAMAEAKRQGFNRAARRAGMPRSSLHSALAVGGNPTMETMLRISDALAIEWTASEQEKSHKR